jgi:hypothetical protein
MSWLLRALMVLTFLIAVAAGVQAVRALGSEQWLGAATWWLSWLLNAYACALCWVYGHKDL